MRVGVAFDDQTTWFEVEEDRLIGRRFASQETEPTALRPRVREALENPREYPPLRLNVVPGDRVVLPFEGSIPEIETILGEICAILMDAGVNAAEITALAIGGTPGAHAFSLPPGVEIRHHDPSHAEEMAYLATTTTERRVYLNRLATDADVVVPVGLLRFGPGRVPQGPWSVIFPGLSNQATQRELRLESARDPVAATREASDASWLLGSQFQVAVEVGSTGVTGIIAGFGKAVQNDGLAALEAAWTLQVEAPADLVLAGIGVPWTPTTLDDLTRGLETAMQIVRPGGKIVALCNLRDVEPGRALRKLAQLDDPRMGPRALRGLEREDDYEPAARLARALVHADIYLYSHLDEDLVEGLGIIPLDRPEDAQRLVNLRPSCLAIHPAEWLQAQVVEADSSVS